MEHMRIKLYVELGARTKQTRTLAIERRIDNLNMRYKDGLISLMEYLDRLSLFVPKRKKRRLSSFSFA